LLWAQGRRPVRGRVQSVATRLVVDATRRMAVPVASYWTSPAFAPAEGPTPSGSSSPVVVWRRPGGHRRDFSDVGELSARTCGTSTKTPRGSWSMPWRRSADVRRWRRAAYGVVRAPSPPRRLQRKRPQTCVFLPGRDAGGAVAVETATSPKCVPIDHPLDQALTAPGQAAELRPEFVPDSLGSTPARRRTRRGARGDPPSGDSFVLRHRVRRAARRRVPALRG